MPTAIAIRHVAFEDLGILEPLLRSRGFAVEYREAGVDDLDTVGDPDLLVVLGGPIGAYEEALYPFLRDELALIARRLGRGGATLGICLGAQLMARALGARVYPGRAKEIGWSPLMLSDAGKDSCLRHFTGGAVLHWHGDTFDLPDGAIRLASTEITANQAFSWGRGRALGLQFHGEAMPAGLERWFIGHACEIAATPGVSVPELRAATRIHGEATARNGAACFTAWLDSLA
jgi:GMP synthase (glutamine-hydrolysing)